MTDIFKVLFVSIWPLIAIAIIAIASNYHEAMKKKQLHQLLKDKNAAWRAQQENKK